MPSHDDEITTAARNEIKRILEWQLERGRQPLPFQFSLVLAAAAVTGAMVGDRKELELMIGRLNGLLASFARECFDQEGQTKH
jgi:hypothetical protein